MSFSVIRFTKVTAEYLIARWSAPGVFAVQLIDFPISSRNGVTSITLTVRGLLYVTLPGPPGCVVSDLGITPVSPAWLQEGSVYIGPQVINGVSCEVWDKS